MVVGIDEVGRGAWAGPLCIVAVGLGGVSIDGLTDSKKLTKKKREQFSLLIKQEAPLVGIGWVSAAAIDSIGMSEALKLAARRAVAQLDSSQISQIIIDGTIRLIDDPRATVMKQADLLVPSVSAASILAKVARDTYMEQVSQVFPEYAFGGHVGYGTVRHRMALDKYGSTPLHRHSFSPLKATLPPVSDKSALTEGARAETAASEYLLRHGYSIVERNWKTKWCEVDIIAHKDSRVYFVEVKYRQKNTYGTGLDAITKKKQRQMKFAAELWLASHDNTESALSSMSLSGADYVVDEFIEIVM